MKAKIIAAVLIASLLTWSASNADPILVVTPSETDTTVGSTIDVTVSITDLSEEFVGDYDIALFYNDSVLSFVDLVFGTFLDGPDDFPIQAVFNNLGSAEALEIAFGSLLNQDGFSPFDLFTVRFDVVNAGVSFLDLGVFSIGNFFGEPIPVGLQGSSIRATQSVAVPEPGTGVLVGLGLLGLMISRRRAFARQAS